MRKRNILIEITAGVGWYENRLGQTMMVKESENPNFDNHWNFTDSHFVKKEHARVLEAGDE